MWTNYVGKKKKSKSCLINQILCNLQESYDPELMVTLSNFITQHVWT